MEMYQGKGMLKTLSWTESGRSVLKLNIRHLWLLGVWPLGHSQVFKVYTSFTFAMGVWSVVECLLAVYFTWGHLEETTLVLIFTSTCSCAIIKLVFFLRDERSYSLMVREVASVMAAQSEACRDPALAAILRDSRSRAFRLSLGMLLFMFSQCFIWFPIPIVANAGERRLPFSQHGWDNNSHFYELSYTLQCLSGLYMSQISFGLDCLFASIMILVAAQLKILSGRVLKLNQEVIPPERNDSVLLRNQLAGDKYRDKFYEGLCFCIDSHQRILRFVTLLQDTMSPVAMAQFASSVVIACMALFQATYGEDLSAALKCASYLPIPGGQVYLYCWAAHSVTENGESVSVAAYSCSWVEGSSRSRHALRTLMARAQRPLVLTAGRLYPINRAAFLSLLNASYSYYALLGQMNKRSMKDLASHN
uniref:Odorant receptor 70a n=1 Tax=Locusta migratoria TaxID=7004 RepID=OR70A_LOCMI|nr:odorant receptor OR70a [Locusta migratoria]